MNPCTKYKDDSLVVRATIPCSYDLSCITAAVNAKDKASMGPFFSKIFKSRFLLHTGPVLCSPTGYRDAGDVFVIATNADIRAGRIAQLLKQHGLKQVGRGLQQVSDSLYAMCLLYSLKVFVAPYWNPVHNYLVEGRDFLTSSGIRNAIHVDVNVEGYCGKVSFSITPFRVGMQPLKLADMLLNQEDKENLMGNSFGVVESRSINFPKALVLPTLKNATVVEISNQMTPSGPIQVYEDLKRHWQDAYGYRLPNGDTPMLFCKVQFGGGWGSDNETSYTYPFLCLNKTRPIMLPTHDSASTIASFLKDTRRKFPQVCGKDMIFDGSSGRPTKSLYKSSQVENLKAPNLQSGPTRKIQTSSAPTIPTATILPLQNITQIVPPTIVRGQMEIESVKPSFTTVAKPIVQQTPRQAAPKTAAVPGSVTPASAVPCFSTVGSPTVQQTPRQTAPKLTATPRLVTPASVPCFTTSVRPIVRQTLQQAAPNPAAVPGPVTPVSVPCFTTVVRPIVQQTPRQPAPNPAAVSSCVPQPNFPTPVRPIVQQTPRQLGAVSGLVTPNFPTAVRPIVQQTPRQPAPWPVAVSSSGTPASVPCFTTGVGPIAQQTPPQPGAKCGQVVPATLPCFSSIVKPTVQRAPKLAVTSPIFLPNNQVDQVVQQLATRPIFLPVSDASVGPGTRILVVKRPANPAHPPDPLKIAKIEQDNVAAINSICDEGQAHRSTVPVLKAWLRAKGLPFRAVERKAELLARVLENLKKS